MRAVHEGEFLFPYKAKIDIAMRRTIRCIQ